MCIALQYTSNAKTPAAARECRACRLLFATLCCAIWWKKACLSKPVRASNRLPIVADDAKQTDGRFLTRMRFCAEANIDSGLWEPRSLSQGPGYANRSVCNGKPRNKSRPHAGRHAFAPPNDIQTDSPGVCVQPSVNALKPQSTYTSLSMPLKRGFRVPSPSAATNM